METRSFKAVEGGRVQAGTAALPARQAVREAQARGYRVGGAVRIGSVAGTVIGYNIAGAGNFNGARFPLLIQTPFGVTKCGVGEVELA